MFDLFALACSATIGVTLDIVSGSQTNRHVNGNMDDNVMCLFTFYFFLYKI
jgi:hypothetical protein